MAQRAAHAVEILYGVGLVLAVVLGLYAWGAFSWYPSSASVFAIGAVAGGLAVFFLRPSIVGLCAHAERPARSVRAMLLVVFFGFSGLVAGALSHLNGALDGSEAEVGSGVVTSVGQKRRLQRQASVRWHHGGTSVVSVDSDTREGDVVTQAIHRGALGWTWVERPVVRRR
jgi:hypothetical protein